MALDLERTDEYDVAVVVPTVADPATLPPTVQAIAQATDGLRVLVVLSVNPLDVEAADLALRACGRVRWPEGCAVAVRREDRAQGFGRACNLGLQSVAAHLGGALPDLVVFHNDDAHPTEGWLREMTASLDPEAVRLWSEMPADMHDKADRSAESYGRIGIVGPMGTNVAGVQGVSGPGEGRDLAGWVRAYRERYAGITGSADFVSGFCMGFRRECLLDLCGEENARPLDGWEPLEGDDPALSVFDERFRPAGYEDNDVCVRAEDLGWRCSVAVGAFVLHLGHQTFDAAFPEADRGMALRRRYLRKHRGRQEGPRHLAACYRVLLEVPSDVLMFRASLQRIAQVADSVAILLTGNPAEMVRRPEWRTYGLEDDDRKMVAECAEAGEDYPEAVRRWAVGLLRRGRRPDLEVEAWSGGFHEARERNRAIEMAERGGEADWILSVDHDELIEDRVTRLHLERLMRHPDPLVRSWDLGWLNHWDSRRLVRTDPPWGDGGRYDGGMHGFRLWRVCKANPRRILGGQESGLHCGNSPEHDGVAKRVAALRMRHLGYLDAHDRRRKHARYHRQDPDPDPDLTGNRGPDGYGHLVDEEGMRMAPYVAECGIGFHQLVYEATDPADVARQLDKLHGLADRIVLVWTGGWNEGDKAWLTGNATPEDPGLHDAHPSEALGPEGEPAGTWPETGPGPRLAEVAALHGAEWVHRPLGDHLGRARNAALEALHDSEGIGWALFFDPDERIGRFGDLVSIRRMAECSNAWGWFVRFANHHRGEDPTYSESIRMSRLDPEGIMRFDGRVHEGFHEALEELKTRGTHPNCRYAPFYVHHTGLALDDHALDRKFRFYQRLLVKQLHDKPHDPGSWVSLARQLRNDGRHEQADECLDRAVACAGDSYLPFEELGYQRLREGQALLTEAGMRLARTHPKRRGIAEVVGLLRKHVPDAPVLGAPRREGSPSCEPIELPPFPPPGEDTAHGGVRGGPESVGRAVAGLLDRALEAGREAAEHLGEGEGTPPEVVSAEGATQADAR